MTDEQRKRVDPVELSIDPNGLWRRQRFEFCTALEVALDATDIRGEPAWAELERLGVKRLSMQYYDWKREQEK